MFLDEDTLREEIKSKRKNLGWSQRKLASEAGVSKSLVGKFERADNVPSYKNIKKIYNALNEADEKDLAEEFAVRDIISVRPSDKVEDAKRIMKENDFSQIPVEEDGGYRGLIVSNQLIDVDNSRKIRSLEYRSLPTIAHDTPKEAFKGLLNHHKAVLVKKGNQLIGIITPADLL